ncbi:choice-of-anchor Q domain-containing protein [Marinicella gelatinilytica]|uniref:choice-of-anchor Q domain-containing protein n=1 Tax=Marinicella gelatinilytica TaxID=2996017 RepID=UPI002260B996|nr:choice-of-anchor Q domain-containing protein [Marinicella gelatinilytica]MCX7545578.1 hypothetical protein [Marinicella gelatinilytica]
MIQKTLEKTCLLIAFLGISWIGTTNAQTCRVSVNGTSGASGVSWQQTKDLVSALNNPSQCHEIWVKSGTYYPTAGTDRSISFFIAPNVKLYGGFYGTETTRSQRDPVNNKAVLSGNLNNSQSNTDNSYNVIYMDGSLQNGYSQDTIIDGFIIRDGNADGTLFKHSNGGGIHCIANGSTSKCSPTLKNLEFINNKADSGGGLFVYSQNDGTIDLKIEHSKFLNNIATNSSTFNNHGGGVHIFSPSSDTSIELNNISFENNLAENEGGAIYTRLNGSGNNHLKINKATFNANIADTGGAVSMSGSESVTTLRNVTFYSNAAMNQGGALYAYSLSTWIYNATFSNNTASSGGAIYGLAKQLNLNSSILWSNSATEGNQITLHDIGLIAKYNVIQNGCQNIHELGSISKVCQNIILQDPKLGALTQNGGFTKTLLPETGSSAINNGHMSYCSLQDQRGVSRPQNGQCDIGSVELTTKCMVKVDGNPNGTGFNWNQDAMTLQAALNTNYCQNIWLKTGTYTPTSGSDRTISFHVDSDVSVIGGFSGTENDLSDRDVENNPVILSGNIGNPNIDTDNSYHVITVGGSSANPVFSNLTISDGYASTSIFDYPDNLGGGVYCDGTGVGNQCNPTFLFVKMLNNHAMAGGAMYNNAAQNGESSPQFVYVTFADNSAQIGGAIVNNSSQQGNSNPIFNQCTFIGNNAVSQSSGIKSKGGAVYNFAEYGNASPQFINCNFSNNFADLGGAIFNQGQTQGTSNPVLMKSQFTSNTANYNGGAMYSLGWDFGQSKPIVEDSRFHNNSAILGGALYLSDLAGNGTAEINRVTFDNNDAVKGGAIYNDGENGYAHPNITNTTFYANTALDDGGAIYNYGEDGASSASITNTTFSGNQANYGGAMYSSGGLNGVSSPTMRHIIMWDNTASTEGDTIYHDRAESTIDDSILEYGCPHTGYGNTNCTNIIDQDPLLGPLADNGGHSKTMLPAPNSPAIDAGDNNHCPGEDQRGESRPKGLACDIGSVEVDNQGPGDLIFKDGFDN